MKESGVGRTFSTHRKVKKLVGKPDGKIPLERQKGIFKNNIKINFKVIGYEGVEWFGFFRTRARWLASATR
jgi:hypothetical protein